MNRKAKLYALLLLLQWSSGSFNQQIKEKVYCDIDLEPAFPFCPIIATLYRPRTEKQKMIIISRQVLLLRSKTEKLPPTRAPTKITDIVCMKINRKPYH